LSVATRPFVNVPLLLSELVPGPVTTTSLVKLAVESALIVTELFVTVGPGPDPEQSMIPGVFSTHAASARVPAMARSAIEATDE
jgi:hypothetical protein